MLDFLSHFDLIFILTKNSLFLLFLQIVVMVLKSACFKGACPCDDINGMSQCWQCSPWHNSVYRASCNDGIDIALHGNVFDNAPHDTMASIALWQWC